jgi:hypothetical protein
MNLQEVRSRLIEVAVDLGWTPPGWRTAPYPSEPRVLDRLGDLALGMLLRDQREQTYN